MTNNETPIVQDPLETGIGTKEKVGLKPAKVKISNVRVDPQKDKNTGKIYPDKAIFTVIYPGREETVDISSIKWEVKNQLKVSGAWFTKDEDGKLQKGSALSTLLTFLKVNTLKECIGMEADTVLDENGYLTFKAF
jgi:hypothetical protein